MYEAVATMDAALACMDVFSSCTLKPPSTHWRTHADPHMNPRGKDRKNDRQRPKNDRQCWTKKKTVIFSDSAPCPQASAGNFERRSTSNFRPQSLSVISTDFLGVLQNSRDFKTSDGSPYSRESKANVCICNFM